MKMGFMEWEEIVKTYKKRYYKPKDDMHYETANKEERKNDKSWRSDT